MHDTPPKPPDHLPDILWDTPHGTLLFRPFNRTLIHAAFLRENGWFRYGGRLYDVFGFFMLTERGWGLSLFSPEEFRVSNVVNGDSNGEILSDPNRPESYRSELAAVAQDALNAAFVQMMAAHPDLEHDLRVHASAQKLHWAFENIAKAEAAVANARAAYDLALAKHAGVCTPRAAL